MSVVRRTRYVYQILQLGCSGYLHFVYGRLVGRRERVSGRSRRTVPAISDLSYEDWIEHAFSHEVRRHGNPWYFDDDPPWWDPPPAVAVAHLTRLFASPEASLAFFSDAQIAQGLTYLVGTSASGDNGWLYSRTVPTDARLACIEAIHELFARLFAPRCPPVLGHLSEPGADAPLSIVCYMWWDEFPCLALPEDPDHQLLHEAAVRVMRRSLQLDSIACQEAALHGLGHWARRHPELVERAVDEFLGANPTVRTELIAYARAARCGCVL